MLSGLGTTAEVKLEKLWYTGKLSWGEKTPSFIYSLYPNYFQRVIACSTRECFSPMRQKGLLHQEGSQRPGCSDLPALPFFGWHNASEFHRTQLQKTHVWIISRHSHFAGMRTSIFKSVLFLPFSLETNYKTKFYEVHQKGGLPSQKTI